MILCLKSLWWIWKWEKKWKQKDTLFCCVQFDSNQTNQRLKRPAPKRSIVFWKNCQKLAASSSGNLLSNSELTSKQKNNKYFIHDETSLYAWKTTLINEKVLTSLGLMESQSQWQSCMQRQWSPLLIAQQTWKVASLNNRHILWTNLVSKKLYQRLSNIDRLCLFQTTLHRPHQNYQLKKYSGRHPPFFKRFVLTSIWVMKASFCATLAIKQSKNISLIRIIDWCSPYGRERFSARRKLSPVSCTGKIHKNSHRPSIFTAEIRTWCTPIDFRDGGTFWLLGCYRYYKKCRTDCVTWWHMKSWS